MGIAQSALVEIANLCVQYTIFPMIFAMWWSNRSLLRGAMAGVVFLFGYTLIVMIGANIGNPLNIYSGLDLDQATLILGTVYCTLAAAYAFMGAGWAYFLQIPELLPFGSRQLPGLDRARRRMMKRDGHKVYTSAGDDPDDSPSSEPPMVISWQYFFVTILAFLAAVGVPQVLYTYFMNIPGDELIAWMLGALVPLPIYLLYWLYCRFAGEPPVFGRSRNYLESDPAGNNYGWSEADIEKEDRKTRFRVAIAIWPMALLHFLGNLALGAVRFYTDDVDNNWLFAVGWWALLLVMALILGAVAYFRASQKEKDKRMAKSAAASDGCDSDEYEEVQDAETSPSTQSRLNTRFRTKLHHALNDA